MHAPGSEVTCTGCQCVAAYDVGCPFIQISLCSVYVHDGFCAGCVVVQCFQQDRLMTTMVADMLLACMQDFLPGLHQGLCGASTG